MSDKWQLAGGWRGPGGGPSAGTRQCVHRKNEIRTNIEELGVQLKTAELVNSSKEDRVRQIERALEDQRSQQNRLLELAARLQAKKNSTRDLLYEKRDIVKNLEAENSVSHNNSLSHLFVVFNPLTTNRQQHCLKPLSGAGLTL